MTAAPPQPQDALEPVEYQRFMYACSHERHSPTARRLIDASSYGWVYQFIQTFSEDAAGPPDPGEGWLDPHDASPRKLGEFFGRVSIRLRRTGAFDYAAQLEKYFHDEADAKELYPPGL